MELRDEVVCITSHPTLPLVAYACRTRSRNLKVDESVVHSNVKIWNYERRAFDYILSECGEVTSVRYSPDGGLLAVARTGDERYTPPTDDSLYRIALYNADDEYRLLKADTDGIDDGVSLHQSNITALAFCHIDLGAGDKTSWGKTSVDLDAAASAAARAVQRPWMKKQTKKAPPLVKYLTLLASGTADGSIRVWDYVGNQWETIPSPDTVAIPSVREISFSTDGRVLTALYTNNTIAMWSFSSSRPRLPKINRELVEARLRAEYDQRRAALEMEDRLKGLRKKSKKKIASEKSAEYERIAEFVETMTDLLPPPAVGLIGHPNLFLRCVVPKDKRERRTLHTMTMIPGYRAPSGYVGGRNDPLAMLTLDDTLPPPYPDADIDTKIVLKMLNRMRAGENFIALFLVKQQDLVYDQADIGLFDATLKAELRKLIEERVREKMEQTDVRLAEEEAVLAADEADDIDFEVFYDAETGEESHRRPRRDEEKDAIRADLARRRTELDMAKRMKKEEDESRVRRKLKRASGGASSDMSVTQHDDEELDMKALAELQEAEKQRMMGTALEEGSDLRILSVGVHIEYIAPLPYPPEALKMVQQFNFERYRLMIAGNHSTGATLPEDYAEPRSVAVLPPVRHVYDPDPVWRAKQEAAEKNRVAPGDREFDVVGELLVRDLHREYLFPLADLEQIQVGKFSVEHLSDEGAGNDPLRCFSLIGKEDQLHIVAPTRQVMNEWICSIRHVLWRAGRNIAPTVISDQFLVDAPPQIEYLDLDIVQALAQNMSLGMIELMASAKRRSKGSVGALQDLTGTGAVTGKAAIEAEEETNPQDPGGDNLDKIFATTCHTYRVFAAGDSFAGILHVRINHEAAYEHYCLDNPNTTRLAGATGTSAPPLEVKPRMTTMQRLNEINMVRLLSVAMGQHSDTELGDWMWAQISSRIRTPIIRACAACGDGRYIVTAETVLPPGMFTDDLEDVTDEDDMLEINQDVNAAMLDTATNQAAASGAAADGTNGDNNDGSGTTGGDGNGNGGDGNGGEGGNNGDGNKDGGDDDGGDDDDAANKDNSLAQVRQRAHAMAAHAVSTWRIADDNLVRFPVGLHDGPVRSVAFLPENLIRRAGSKYIPGMGAYNIASGGDDETLRVWTYAPNDLDVTRSERRPLPPLQVVQRPYFLRAIHEEPSLALQGGGGQHILDVDGGSKVPGVDTKDAPADEDALLSSSIVPPPEKKLTPAQQAAVDRVAMENRLRKLKYAEQNIYREATIAVGDDSAPNKPGTQIKQLNRLLSVRSAESLGDDDIEEFEFPDDD